jgi:hypothetical protein
MRSNIPCANAVDSRATAATRDGHLAENWNNPSHGRHRVVLSYPPTPVPERGSGGLAAAGLALLAIVSWRTRHA